MSEPTLRIDADTSAFKAAAAKIERAGARANPAIARAMNRALDIANTQVVRALTPQTGLKRQVIVRAVKKHKASAGNLVASLTARGGNIRVKFFSPRETPAGVVAKPRGKATLYAGSWMRGGLWPNRVEFRRAGMRGNVYERTGKARFPRRQTRSGVFIPDEMVSGATKAAFLASVASVLPRRLAHELDRALAGK